MVGSLVLGRLKNRGGRGAKRTKKGGHREGISTAIKRKGKNLQSKPFSVKNRNFKGQLLWGGEKGERKNVVS